MATADDLAAVVATLQPVAEDLALPDTCAIVRKGTGAKDSRGNAVASESTVATVRCRLRSTFLHPREQATADLVRSTTRYVVDLPKATDVIPADVLLVNGSRRFEVVGIVKDGGFGVLQTAVVEERG